MEKVFRANDGTIFETEEKCLQYEMEHDTTSYFMMFDSKGIQTNDANRMFYFAIGGPYGYKMALDALSDEDGEDNIVLSDDCSNSEILRDEKTHGFYMYFDCWEEYQLVALPNEYEMFSEMLLQCWRKENSK